MSFGYSEFRLTKRTGTYADVLAAAGLSHMLWTLQRDSENEIREERGYFRVVLSEPLNLEEIEIDTLLRKPLYEFITTKPGEHAPAGIVPLITQARKR
jgi:hypothetical protein